MRGGILGISVGLAAVVFCLSTPASARTTTFDISSVNGDPTPFALFGTLDFSSIGGVKEVTSVDVTGFEGPPFHGFLNGVVSAGLSTYADADQRLPPDFGGFSFNLQGTSNTAFSDVINVFTQNGKPYAVFQTVDPVGYAQSAELVNLTIGSVPEPATWALMLIGFGGIGAALRTTRQRTLATAA
jgi:hypothetical protein